MARHLVGSQDANGTYFYLTDALGSINNPTGGAVIKENQVFGPYGNVSYYAGTLNTAKGFKGVSLDDAVSAKLASEDPGARAEGEVGAIASLYSKLIRFNNQYGLRRAGGEVDAEIPEAIIEAKSGSLQGQLPKIEEQFKNTVINPDRKPFVLYATSWTPNQVRAVY